MIRVLLDQGIGHSAGPELAAAGWDVRHVRDFHALLAVSGERAPSVVRIRQEGLSGIDFARLLLKIWPDIADSLALGAVVSVTEHRIRVRRLPVAGKAADVSEQTGGLG